MKLHLAQRAFPSLVAALTISATSHGQTIGIRVDDRVHVDVDTIPTEQFWVAESLDLTNWTNHTFVDHSISIDCGPPASDQQFYRLDQLYGPITWTQLPDMPIARDQFAGGVIDGILYLFGGNGPPNPPYFDDLSRMDIYDPATGQWTQGASYTFGIEELSSAVVGGKLYIFGGYGEGSTVRVNLCYDPFSDTWSEKTTKPTHTEQSTAVAWGDEILLLGGNFPVSDEISTTVEAYNTITNEWRFVTDIPEPLWNFAAGIHDNVLYVVGGLAGGIKQLDMLIPSNKVHRFDLLNGIWLPDIVGILPRPIGVPYSSACPIVNGHMIIAGGGTSDDGSFTNPESDPVVSNLVVAYDIKNNSFAENTPLPDTFASHIVLLAYDKLFVCGGNAGPDITDDVPTSRVYMGTFTE